MFCCCCFFQVVQSLCLVDVYHSVSFRFSHSLPAAMTMTLMTLTKHPIHCDSSHRHHPHPHAPPRVFETTLSPSVSSPHPQHPETQSQTRRSNPLFPPDPHVSSFPFPSLFLCVPDISPHRLTTSPFRRRSSSQPVPPPSGRRPSSRASSISDHHPPACTYYVPFVTIRRPRRRSRKHDGNGCGRRDDNRA